MSQPKGKNKNNGHQICISMPVEIYISMKKKIELLTAMNNKLSIQIKELQTENEYLKYCLNDDELTDVNNNDSNEYVDAGPFPSLKSTNITNNTSNYSIDSNLSIQ
mmetsp:Transcript_42523/g.52353  ORF Transcript_42523/g.52353 Transcript_42523/m.52353 type:complete len:106 (+) Transcript_42523:30-347(+)